MQKQFVDRRYSHNLKVLEGLQKVGSHKSVDLVIELLVDYKNFIYFYEERLLGILGQIDKKYSTDKLFELIGQRELDDDQLLRVIIVLTDLIGAENARDQFNVLIERDSSQQICDRLEYARSFITPNHDKKAVVNLQTFYQKNIKFEEYKVNEKMNEGEVVLLEELIEEDEKALEMGCGTGRLMKELVKNGRDVTGYDYTERHAQITKKSIEESGKEAKVFQGDWHNNAVKDESMEVVYSLGRNILHDYSIADQVQLFREANRILKKSGRFIFDIPNRDKGGYKKMVDEYVSEMKKRKIKNFRHGTIYDSPDGEHFATRYAYSHEDIGELAKMSGFHIVEVKKFELETGQDDENWYYVLEKI